MITIIDYKAGNIRSIQNMLRKLGYQSQISDKVETIAAAEKLILPGVGSFDHGVEQLQTSNLFDTIVEKATNGTPLLGICLGAQLMGLNSEEGKQSGLGFFNMRNVKFDTNRLNLQQKVPHMGWSHINLRKNSSIINNQSEDHRYYFVHSYHFSTDDAAIVSATCNYAYEFPCGLEKGNIFALQFHPEKSHRYGMEILKKFAEL
ncbi:imidazole glycerol phosphate synthase subunit HisH [Carboxylicivirga sp. N1Y90]|uniref:imidazole glycerol phosphate synthase subunit HisH n=1 Tax=Carboxylicivirga fragile TaxID=3417571 RepID=UPI003D3352A7|nr:imidazole glycerol phosphate synthase subunit HisH [Marinilabiliaceae bacterium N1Y90]